MLRSVLPVLLLAPLASGCVAVAAASVVGIGIVQYHRNELEQDFGTDLQDTFQAVLEGLRRLGIEPGVHELGPSEGRIEHDDMVVVVERHLEGFTRVRVRVGTFHSRDHERRAGIVLQEISASIEGEDELRAWAEKVTGKPPPGEDPQPE